MSIKVLLADDSDLMRSAIIRLLKNDPEIEVVAETTSFAQTMQTAETLRPNVVVVDLHMGKEEVSPALVKSSLAHSCLLAISVAFDTEAHALAESFGAVRLIDKMHLATQLIPAIRHCVEPHPHRVPQKFRDIQDAA